MLEIDVDALRNHPLISKVSEEVKEFHLYPRICHVLNGECEFFTALDDLMKRLKLLRARLF